MTHEDWVAGLKDNEKEEWMVSTKSCGMRPRNVLNGVAAAASAPSSFTWGGENWCICATFGFCWNAHALQKYSIN